MLQGITLATQGMSVLMQKQDQIANNLANMNTTGFKQSNLFISAYEKYLNNDEMKPFANREITADEVHIDFREGPAMQTGNDLDLMVQGSGFFTVMTPNGVRYTRNGNFSLNQDGFLVTSDGSKVMSTEGFIRFDRDGGTMRANTNGEILQGEIPRGVLRIVDFKKPYAMLRDGSSYFKPQLPNNPVVQSAGYVIKQGYLEGSNAGSIQNMVEMISTHRNYEADQRALLAQDQTLDKAVNSVGRLG
jgi:flagellar basal-body rod protein FlgG